MHWVFRVVHRFLLTFQTAPRGFLQERQEFTLYFLENR
jgi:hypothetical protein